MKLSYYLKGQFKKLLKEDLIRQHLSKKSEEDKHAISSQAHQFLFENEMDEVSLTDLQAIINKLFMGWRMWQAEVSRKNQGRVPEHVFNAFIKGVEDSKVSYQGLTHFYADYCQLAGILAQHPELLANEFFNIKHFIKVLLIVDAPKHQKQLVLLVKCVRRYNPALLAKMATALEDLKNCPWIKDQVADLKAVIQLQQAQVVDAEKEKSLQSQVNLHGVTALLDALPGLQKLFRAGKCKGLQSLISKITVESQQIRLFEILESFYQRLLSTESQHSADEESKSENAVVNKSSSVLTWELLLELIESIQLNKNLLRQNLLLETLENFIVDAFIKNRFDVFVALVNLCQGQGLRLPLFEVVKPNEQQSEESKQESAAALSQAIVSTDTRQHLNQIFQQSNSIEIIQAITQCLLDSKDAKLNEHQQVWVNFLLENSSKWDIKNFNWMCTLFGQIARLAVNDEVKYQFAKIYLQESFANSQLSITEYKNGAAFDAAILLGLLLPHVVLLDKLGEISPAKVTAPQVVEFLKASKGVLITHPDRRADFAKFIFAFMKHKKLLGPTDVELVNRGIAGCQEVLIRHLWAKVLVSVAIEKKYALKAFLQYLSALKLEQNSDYLVDFVRGVSVAWSIQQKIACLQKIYETSDHGKLFFMNVYRELHDKEVLKEMFAKEFVNGRTIIKLKFYCLQALEMQTRVALFGDESLHDTLLKLFSVFAKFENDFYKDTTVFWLMLLFKQRVQESENTSLGYLKELVNYVGDNKTISLNTFARVLQNIPLADLKQAENSLVVLADEATLRANNLSILAELAQSFFANKDFEKLDVLLKFLEDKRLSLPRSFVHSERFCEDLPDNESKSQQHAEQKSSEQAESQSHKALASGIFNEGGLDQFLGQPLNRNRISCVAMALSGIDKDSEKRDFAIYLANRLFQGNNIDYADDYIFYRQQIDTLQPTDSVVKDGLLLLKETSKTVNQNLIGSMLTSLGKNKNQWQQNHWDRQLAYLLFNLQKHSLERPVLKRERCVGDAAVRRLSSIPSDLSLLPQDLEDLADCDSVISSNRVALASQSRTEDGDDDLANPITSFCDFAADVPVDLKTAPTPIKPIPSTLTELSVPEARQESKLSLGSFADTVKTKLTHKFIRKEILKLFVMRLIVKHQQRTIAENDRQLLESVVGDIHRVKKQEFKNLQAYKAFIEGNCSNLLSLLLLTHTGKLSQLVRHKSQRFITGASSDIWEKANEAELITEDVQQKRVSFDSSING